MSTTEVNNQLLVNSLAKAFAEDHCDDLLESFEETLEKFITWKLNEASDGLDVDNEDLIMEVEYLAVSQLVELATNKLKAKYA